MASIIYFGTHGCPGHRAEGIDTSLSRSEYEMWSRIDNDRWVAEITRVPGYGYLMDIDGSIAYTRYAFPWSVDDDRGGSHTDLFWEGEHSEQAVLALIMNHPFLKKQFKL